MVEKVCRSIFFLVCLLLKTEILKSWSELLLHSITLWWALHGHFVRKVLMNFQFTRVPKWRKVSHQLLILWGKFFSKIIFPDAKHKIISSHQSWSCLLELQSFASFSDYETGKLRSFPQMLTLFKEHSQRIFIEMTFDETKDWEKLHASAKYIPPDCWSNEWKNPFFFVPPSPNQNITSFRQSNDY